MKFARILAVSAAAAAILAIPAAAQDINADPNYTTLRLRSGFLPDPRVVSLRAGGGIPARAARTGCAGFISNAPDVRLHYQAGRLPLIISADSRADTTLVVNGPDGRWYCDDDGGERGMNPSIRIQRPRSGRYEIWVGSYQRGVTPPARLHISEVRSQ